MTLRSRLYSERPGYDQAPSHGWRVQAFADIWIPLLSTIVALAGVLGGTLSSYRASVTRVEVARYDRTFPLKYEGYVKCIQALDRARAAAGDKDLALLQASLHSVHDNLVALEPFLGNTRLPAREDVKVLRDHIYKVYYGQFGEAQKGSAAHPVPAERVDFEGIRDHLGDLLYDQLFR